MLFIGETCTGELSHSPSNTQDVNTLVRGHVIGGCFDLPARAMVRNSMQFNGEYGCTYCEQPGDVIQTRQGGLVHIYPFDERNPDGPHPTAATANKYAEVAVKEKQVVS